jgi:hypothetical protein
MNENETAALVRAFDRAYINGKFVTPHGTQVVDLVNPTNNRVIGKVTMADEIDTRQAIAAAKEAFNTFSQSSKEYRMDCLQRLHDAVAKRMDQLVDATVLEYGAPQDRAKGSNNLAANIFLHFKEVLKDFDLEKNCRDFQSRHGTGGRGGHIHAVEFERRFDRDQGGSGNRCRMHCCHQAQRDERDANGSVDGRFS